MPSHPNYGPEALIQHFRCPACGDRNVVIQQAITEHGTRLKCRTCGLRHTVKGEPGKPKHLVADEILPFLEKKAGKKAKKVK